MNKSTIPAQSVVQTLPFNVDIGVYDYQTDELIAHQHQHNTVLDSGLAAIWRCFTQTGPPLNGIALSSGVDGPVDGVLPNEVWRSDLSRVSVDGPILVAQFYLASSMCVGKTINSAMLLAGTIPFAFVTLDARIKTNDEYWVIIWSFPLEAV